MTIQAQTAETVNTEVRRDAARWLHNAYGRATARSRDASDRASGPRRMQRETGHDATQNSRAAATFRCVCCCCCCQPRAMCAPREPVGDERAKGEVWHQIVREALAPCVGPTQHNTTQHDRGGEPASVRLRSKLSRARQLQQTRRGVGAAPRPPRAPVVGSVRLSLSHVRSASLSYVTPVERDQSAQQATKAPAS